MFPTVSNHNWVVEPLVLTDNQPAVESTAESPSPSTNRIGPLSPVDEVMPAIDNTGGTDLDCDSGSDYEEEAETEKDDAGSIEYLQDRFADIFDHLDHLPSYWSTAYKQYRRVNLTLDIATFYGLQVDYGRHSVNLPPNNVNNRMTLPALVEALDIDRWISFKNKLTLYFFVQELVGLCEVAIGKGESDSWSDSVEEYRKLLHHWVNSEPIGNEWWTKGKYSGDDTRADLSRLIKVSTVLVYSAYYLTECACCPRNSSPEGSEKG
jgi:hypothetical protein